MRTRKGLIAGLTAGLLVLTSSAVLADDLNVLDDELVALSGIEFGETCVGDTASLTVSLQLTRGGGGQVYANGSLVEITGSGPEGVSAEMASITVPDDWFTGDQSADNGKLSEVATSAVTLDTTSTRTVDGTLEFTASGPRQSGTGGGTGDVERTDSVSVSGAVVECAGDDETPPVITPSVAGTLGDNGWYVGDVTLEWLVVDPDSDITDTDGCEDISITVDQAATTYTCTATSEGGEASASVTIKRDATPPTIEGSATPEANAAGWNNTDVEVGFECDDELSGVASCGPDATLEDEGEGQQVAGTAVDEAGNEATATVGGIKIDKTAPDVTLEGGPEETSYYPHEVPDAPTCNATDVLSGVNAEGCTVRGYSSDVGVHEVTGTATDVAGNEGTASVTYTVSAYDLDGFYRPVDMDVDNAVKAGRTVPLKFQVFAGDEEMTDTDVVQSIRRSTIPCENAGTSEELEDAEATGGTGLRYDEQEGQFAFNWQTPRSGSGSCHRLTVTMVGGQQLRADFHLR